ncbi:hypothetical protein AB0D67_08285 [Streptosporangium sp. NPDC048047]
MRRKTGPAAVLGVENVDGLRGRPSQWPHQGRIGEIGPAVGPIP